MGKETDRKGKIGVGFVCSNLMSNGIDVLIPISEHLPFDVVGYFEGKLYKIQVKYSKIINGKISISLASVLLKDGRYKRVRYLDGDIDIFAVYCPDNNKVYYVNAEKTKGLKQQIVLRIDKPKHKGGQRKIRWAEDYSNFRNIVK